MQISFFDPRNFPIKPEIVSGRKILKKITILICQHLSENEKSEINDGDNNKMKERVEIVLRDELIDFHKNGHISKNRFTKNMNM